ncbi:ABC transporter ATP-binding protein [Oceanivirga salmonicida]|uniref:ABC transporter ATP-binding protein n=1 Tax=Oceanivirga salmonicida TaxID=1769291 RepID=UPI0008373EF3|nr:ABC transporter ATP-binding protein [Oceanivirga salmonicida]
MKVFNTIKKILSLSDKKAYLLIIATVIISITTFFSLQGPYLIGKMTNLVVEGINTGIDYTSLKSMFYLIIAIYLIVMILNAIQNLLVFRITTNINYEIRKKINDKVNKLGISHLDKTKDGDIISLIVNDVDKLITALWGIIYSTLPVIISVVGIIVFMMIISIKLTLIVLVFIPMTILTISMVVKKSQKYFKSLQSKLASLNAYIEEMYTNQEIVLAFNSQKESIENFEKINDKIYKSLFLSQALSSLVMPLISALNTINYVVISLVGSILVFNKTLSLGGFQAFIHYLNLFHRPLSMSSQVSVYFQQLSATSERIFKFLELEEMEDESKFKKLNIDNIEGNIDFENVVFSYNEDKTIINSINFSVKKGEKIGIIGHTGSGKTTIINLLMKFYDINSGDIKIDGISIKDIRKDDIAKAFTMVLQDTWLFNGTISKNIEFGASNEVSFNDIERASKNANSHHFIKTLNDGYKTMINEEADNISAGQKQQLTIARAFLKNSKIIILDEATSSIDSRTELLIQDAIKNLMKDKTTFIIAHRLSTIKNCDKIILLDDGNIVEMGSHKELMNKDGEYKKLYQAQF